MEALGQGSAVTPAWPELRAWGRGWGGGNEEIDVPLPSMPSLLCASHRVSPGDVPSRDLQTQAGKRDAQTGPPVNRELQHRGRGGGPRAGD